jgi:hypothetical protein
MGELGVVQSRMVALVDEQGKARDMIEVDREMLDFINTYVLPFGGAVMPCGTPVGAAGTEGMPTAFVWFRMPLTGTGDSQQGSAAGGVQ